MRQAEIAKGFAWTALFTIINRVCLPIVGIVIAGRIGPAGLGIYAALNSLSVLVDLFREAGLSLTYVADQDRSKERERAYSGLALLLGLFFAGLMVLCRFWLADVFKEPKVGDAVFLLAGSMVLSSIAVLPVNRLVKDGRFRDAGLIDTGANLLSYVLAIFLVWKGVGFEALVWQMAVRNLLYATACSTQSPLVFGRFEWVAAKSILRQSMANMASNVAYTVYTMGDYLLITHYFGRFANGNYAAAYNVANKPVDLISGPLLRTAFVALSRSQDDKERFGRGFARILAVTVLIAPTAYAMLFFHADGVVWILYRDKFYLTAELLRILVLYLGCRSIGVVGAASLVAAGKPKWTAITWIPGYTIAIAGLFLAIRNNNLNGAVWALTAGAVVVYGLNMIAAMRILKPSREDMKSVWVALVVVLPSILVAAGTAFLPLPIVPRFLVGSLAVTLTWGVVVGVKYLGNPLRLASKSGLKALIEKI